MCEFPRVCIKVLELYFHQKVRARASGRLLGTAQDHTDTEVHQLLAVHIYMEAADTPQDGSADDSAEPSFASGLLPHEHAFSLSVAEQRDCLQKDLPRGVTACASAGPGLVLLTLRAGRADGYGARAWPLLVGGAGLGDEPELAQMLGVP